MIMFNIPALGIDWELIPNDFYDLSEAALRRYEDRLLMLGSKDKPFYDERVDANFHNDGLFAEVATGHPLRTPDEMLGVLDLLVSRYERHVGLPLTAMDFVELSEARRFTPEIVPRLYKEASRFGCSPDYLRGKRRSVPGLLKKSPVREAGLHFHMNLAEQYRDTRSVRDMELGREPTNAVVCSRVAEEFYEATAFLHERYDRNMRLWYRSPRLYRPKPYGIEYRSFGAGIGVNKDKMSLLTNIAFEFMRDHFKTHSQFVSMAGAA